MPLPCRRSMRRYMGSDIDDGLTRLRALIGPDQSPDRLVAFVHGGPPISKARARWAKGGKFAYTPKTTTNAQRALALRFRSATGQKQFLDNVAIIAIFYRQNLQRIDGDNLMKLVMDAGTEAGIWRDDSQVTAHAALIEYAPESPRTVIALCSYVSSLIRGPEIIECATCGKSFERPKWRGTKNGKPVSSRYCSGLCRQARRLVEATCPRCDKPFKRRTAGQRYCSMECRNADRGKRLPNGEQRIPAVCEKCGQPVSRRGYKQCRACRGYGRPKSQHEIGQRG